MVISYSLSQHTHLNPTALNLSANRQTHTFNMNNLQTNGINNSL